MNEKINIEEINIEEINVDKLFDDVGNETRLFIPIDEKEFNFKIAKLSKKIADNVLSKIKGKDDALLVFDKLLVLVDKLNFSPIAANLLFNRLKRSLSKEQMKFSEENEEFDNYKNLLIELESAAKSYFKYIIYDELRDFDLPEKLKWVKLAQFQPFPEDEYRKKALTEIQKTLENEIALNKEEITNRQNLVLSNKNTDEKENSKKNEDLNKETATLFMNYLFDYAKISCNFTKKAEVIEFLTGFSKKQVVKLPSVFGKQKLEIEDGGGINEKFFKDMNTVRKYFEKLGLDEVVEKIDKDLGN